MAEAAASRQVVAGCLLSGLRSMGWGGGYSSRKRGMGFLFHSIKYPSKPGNKASKTKRGKPFSGVEGCSQ